MGQCLNGCGKETKRGRLSCGDRSCVTAVRAKKDPDKKGVCLSCDKEFEGRKGNSYCYQENEFVCEACATTFTVRCNSRRRRTCSNSCLSSLSHTVEAKETRRRKSIERYGVEHVTQSEGMKAQSKATFLERYGVEHALQHPDFILKSQETLAEGLRSGRTTTYGGRISGLNAKLAKRIEEECGVKMNLEERVGDYSYDMGNAALKVAIELNPTVSHNSDLSFGCIMKKCRPAGIQCPLHGDKITPRGYHFDRAVNAKKAGWRLIQIYDWDNDDDILNFISGKVKPGFKKISARKLTLKKIEQVEANRFLKENHIQGAGRKQTHCYGLFSEEELITVATFSEARFKSKSTWEFNRYAAKRGVIIHGASNRLWKAFIAEVNPDSVVSYIDFNHTTAPSVFLNSLGFEEKAPTGPALVWFRQKDKKRILENTLLAKGADMLLGTAYGSRKNSGLDNHDIMRLEGFLPVNTAGNRVFLWASPSVQ